MHPFYVIRALGGALFLTGALIMAFNLWKTVTNGRQRADDTVRAALSPAE